MFCWKKRGRCHFSCSKKFHFKNGEIGTTLINFLLFFSFILYYHFFLRNLVVRYIFKYINRDKERRCILVFSKRRLRDVLSFVPRATLMSACSCNLKAWGLNRSQVKQNVVWYYSLPLQTTNLNSRKRKLCAKEEFWRCTVCWFHGSPFRGFSIVFVFWLAKV